MLVLVLTASEGRVEASASALSWRACGGSFQCATLQVPLDYADPGGRQIELALIRQPARDPSRRIGSLVMNPGGPGASGVEVLRTWATRVSAELQARFDLVSFDPRGVGGSTPIDCHDRIQQFAALDPLPQTAADWQPIVAEAKAFADLCSQRNGDLLPFLGTRNVAMDVDRIREALGEEKLTFAGISYGTAIGAAYADLFPERVRAMLLDGVWDGSLGFDQLLVQQSAGYEGAYQHFLAYCRASQCLPVSAGDPAAAIDGLLERSKATPIAAPRADRPAGRGETLLAIITALYAKEYWQPLAQALTAALAGDGTGLVRLADQYLGRQPNGSYNNSLEVYTAVNCADYQLSRDPAHYQQLAQQAAATSSSHFAIWNIEGELPCAFWPAGASPLRAPQPAAVAPILLVGTTADPATPYAWAQSVSRRLPGSVLLTYRADGHTGYLRGNSCVDAAVNAYLVSLQLPAPDSVCGDASLAEAFQVVPPTATPPPPAAVAATQPAASEAPAPSDQEPSHADGGRSSGELLAGAVVIVVLMAGAVIVFLRSRS